MKNPKELVAQAKNRAQKFYKSNEIVREVFITLENFERREIAEWTGDELSRFITKLATLSVNLGLLVAEKTLMSNASYIYQKWKRAYEYKRIRRTVEKISQKDADDQAMMDTVMEITQEAENRYIADVIKTLHEDISRLVMAIQSRIKVLEGEKIASSMAEDSPERS